MSEQYKRCIGRNPDGTRCNAIGAFKYVSYASNRKERCLCEYHARQLASYNAENAAKVGTPRKMNDIRRRQTISYELEVSHDSENARGNLAEKGFIPTSDITVTAEYKPPIWTSAQAAIGSCKTVQTLINNGDIAIGSNCGTHIHIGLINGENTSGFSQYRDYIKRFYHSLFLPLSDFLNALPDNGAEIFGRPFGSWSRPISAYTDPLEHTNFINIQHVYSIEFRQPVFKSAEQFSRAIRLCRRWQEIAVAWAMNFDSYRDRDERRATARAASAKMIAEYERAIREGYGYDIGK